MAVSAVDTKGSETPTHLLVNMKKIQMNRELQAVIEKQNLIHSNKLNAIRQSQGRLDNWNFYPQCSLNAAQQRQTLNKISYENGKILERILRRESEYGRWESEWDKVKQIQANISRYPQVTWAGQHRVTFMDYKRNMDIHNLFEGSETDSTQSRSTLKLDSIPKKADHHRKKEHSNLTDNRKGLNSMQTEKLVEADSDDKAHCCSRQGSPYRFCKRGIVISATLGKDNYTDETKYGSDRKSFSKPKNCAKFSGTGKREQEAFTERKDSYQEEYKNEKSQPGSECETKLKNAKKQSMSYESSAQTFESIEEETDVSSCYSFDGSKGSSSSCSSRSSGMSETLSSLDIKLKTRMASASSTSIRSVETPVGSSHKLKISNTPNVYTGRDPSSQESRITPTSVRHLDTPATSFHKLNISDRQNVYSSQDMSLSESKKSINNYDIQQSRNRSTELSERMSNSSSESLVIYPQKWPI